MPKPAMAFCQVQQVRYTKVLPPAVHTRTAVRYSVKHLSHILACSSLSVNDSWLPMAIYVRWRLHSVAGLLLLLHLAGR